MVNILQLGIALAAGTEAATRVIPWQLFYASSHPMVIIVVKYGFFFSHMRNLAETLEAACSALEP